MPDFDELLPTDIVFLARHSGTFLVPCRIRETGIEESTLAESLRETDILKGFPKFLRDIKLITTIRCLGMVRRLQIIQTEISSQRCREILKPLKTC